MKILLAGYSSFFSRRHLIFAINEAQQRAIAAFNEAIAPDQEWVRISPFGEFPNRVGLQVFDRAAAEKMVQAFNSVSGQASRLFRGLPIYVGHPDDAGWRKENPGTRAEAVGRIRKLEVRQDGLFGQMALNEEGKRLISGDAAPYEAHSPHWGMTPIAGRAKTFRPVELLSIGLTNQPNIPGTHIGLNEAELAAHSAMNKHIIALLAALGRSIAADSTDEQLAAAVNETVAVATKFVGDAGKFTAAINDKAALQTQLDAANAKVTAAVNETAGLKTQLTAAINARAETVITSAINEGRITQAQKAEWLGKFTAAGADFAIVSGELVALKKALNTKDRMSALGARKEEVNAANSKITAINDAVAVEMKATNCTHDQAYAKVRAAKPDLFAAE